MAYLLIDPPVNPLSPPAKIQEWVEELTRWSTEPRYSDPRVRTQIQRAIDEARSWLADALPSGSVADVRREPRR